jgi:iron complex transport system ATP-binding protein
VTIGIVDLAHRYGAIEALRDVTVSARPGRITALIGPNAAGKSTLLRCVIGVVRPTGGSVLIDGRPAHAMRPRELAARVAYVPQRPVLSAPFTVREVVRLGRYALPPSPARTRQAIDRLEIGDLADRPYPSLSTGQQQRATLARAVAQVADDGHLVLDEPTSAMDLRHVRRCARVLREAADAGVTVIVAMHDLTLVASIADDAWLLDAGRLVASGPATEVLAPDRLAAVFATPFLSLQDPDGKPVLIADIAQDP